MRQHCCGLAGPLGRLVGLRNLTDRHEKYWSGGCLVRFLCTLLPLTLTSVCIMCVSFAWMTFLCLDPTLTSGRPSYIRFFFLDRVSILSILSVTSFT